MMWNSPHRLHADRSYAVRMVLTGYATPAQAANACGLSLEEIHAMLAACPQLRLQEVATSQRKPLTRGAMR